MDVSLSEPRELVIDREAWRATIHGVTKSRTRLSTPVFLPGESHGQRNLVGYSPQGHKESDMTEVN